MKAAQDYSEAILLAEKAVASVKDPDLKKIAFQKVLDDLLNSSPNARRLTRSSPSLVVAAKQRVNKAGPRGGPKGYIEELIAEGFFKKPKSISEIRRELENRGHHIPLTSLSGPLQRLCQQKQLRRQKAPESGSYAYSEW